MFHWNVYCRNPITGYRCTYVTFTRSSAIGIAKRLRSEDGNNIVGIEQIF